MPQYQNTEQKERKKRKLKFNTFVDVPSKLVFLILILTAYIGIPNFFPCPVCIYRMQVFSFCCVLPLQYFKTLFCHINFTSLCIPSQSHQN